MSPEQAAGRMESLGPASDVYSLGVTLYVLLTDQRPFAGEAEQILAGRQAGAVLAAERRKKPAVPKALEAICLRAMAREPSRSVCIGAATGGGYRALAGGRAGLGVEGSMAGPLVAGGCGGTNRSSPAVRRPSAWRYWGWRLAVPVFRWRGETNQPRDGTSKS